MTVRRLTSVLGDQLSWNLPPLAEIDPSQDQLLMTEVDAEAKSAPTTGKNHPDLFRHAPLSRGSSGQGAVYNLCHLCPGQQL